MRLLTEKEKEELMEMSNYEIIEEYFEKHKLSDSEHLFESQHGNRSVDKIIEAINDKPTSLEQLGVIVVALIGTAVCVGIFLLALLFIVAIYI